MTDLYSNRKIYRDLSGRQKLFPFRVTSGETDLFIQTSEKSLESVAEKTVNKTRKIIKEYIKINPEFETSFTPLPFDPDSHRIIQKMLSASEKAGLGPMATVAGCLAEETGLNLLKFCDEVIIENGGDIFIKSDIPFITGIYAGEASPFSNKIGLKLNFQHPAGICTSSGTLGHSKSFGKADAVCVISENAYTADAFATSLCNMVKTDNDIVKALEEAKKQKDIKGILIIKGDKTGAEGNIEIVGI
ncbi:MAG: UPF0280 family protein [Thermodesulfobacteriota bacterium]